MSTGPGVSRGVGSCVAGSGVSSVGSAKGRLHALPDLLTLLLLRSAIVNVAPDPRVPFPAAPASNLSSKYWKRDQSYKAVPNPEKKGFSPAVGKKR